MLIICIALHVKLIKIAEQDKALYSFGVSKKQAYQYHETGSVENVQWKQQLVSRGLAFSVSSFSAFRWFSIELSSSKPLLLALPLGIIIRTVKAYWPFYLSARGVHHLVSIEVQ